MGYKLQLISCTNTVHIHNGNYVINLSHYPAFPLIRHTTQLHTQTHYSQPKTHYSQPKTDSLCMFTNLYRSRLCDITNSHFLCILTLNASNLYVQLLHFCNRRQTPQIYSLNFYFLLLHFLLFCNINVLHIL